MNEPARSRRARDDIISVDGRVPADGLPADGLPAYVAYLLLSPSGRCRLSADVAFRSGDAFRGDVTIEPGPLSYIDEIVSIRRDERRVTPAPGCRTAWLACVAAPNAARDQALMRLRPAADGANRKAPAAITTNITITVMLLLAGVPSSCSNTTARTSLIVAPSQRTSIT